MELEKYHQIKNFGFIIEDMTQGKTGMGWEGIFGKTHLFIDGEKVISKGFELTSTVCEFYLGIKNLFEKGRDGNTYFCCTCGDHGCAYIHWDLALKDGTIFINMENLLGEPIGKHLYSIDSYKFIEGILYLYGKVTEYMRKNNIKKVQRGELKDFERMQSEIKSYLK